MLPMQALPKVVSTFYLLQPGQTRLPYLVQLGGTARILQSSNM